MKNIVLLFFLVGCGTIKVKNSGTSTVEHKITIDLSVCEQLPEKEDKIECIKTLLDTLKQIKEKEIRDRE